MLPRLRVNAAAAQQVQRQIGRCSKNPKKQKQNKKMNRQATEMKQGGGMSKRLNI